MIRVLLSFLLLEIFYANALQKESHFNYGNYPNNLGKNLRLVDSQHSRRVARSTSPPPSTSKTFAQPGNYLSTVIFVDLPVFSNWTDVGDVKSETDKFSIEYYNSKFYKLSSAFALAYRIDLDAKQVQLLLRLGKAQIKGSYSVTSPTCPKTANQDYELNLYANLIYTYNIEFEFENGKAQFGKTSNYRLLYNKVKGVYINPPSELASSLNNYLDPKLLEAVVAKSYNEVSQKVTLEEVGFQIKNEFAFRARNQIADRLKKAIARAFEDVAQNAFNVFYYDRSNFSRIIHNYEVTIPSFILRDVEGFHSTATVITFVRSEVCAKTTFAISSPLALFNVVYRRRDDPHAPSKTVSAEFRISNASYEFELIAAPETNTVELGNVVITASQCQVASCQGLYGDEGDIIIQELTPYMMSYFQDASYHSFSQYLRGLVAEGQIEYETFN